MQISLEELQRRLTSNNNLVNSCGVESNCVKDVAENQSVDTHVTQTNIKIKSKKGNDSTNKLGAGRKSNATNAPKELRLVAGICSKIDNGTTAAKELGLTTGQTRYAKRNSDKITEEQVDEIAVSRLLDTLGLLNPMMLVSETPKDISAIAANLSKIHANLKPEKAENQSKVNITIFAPEQKTEADFETIEVRTGT